jgi:hypothetical protein
MMPKPVAISCRNTHTEGPQRSDICGTAWCRETDWKHKVGAIGKRCRPARLAMKHLRMLSIRLAGNSDAINELQWYQFRHTKARN